MLSPTPGALWRIGKYHYIVLGHKKKEQSLEGGDEHTQTWMAVASVCWPAPPFQRSVSGRRHSAPWVLWQFPGSASPAPSPQHGVQGGLVILTVGYGFLAGICFRCNLYQEENHKESQPHWHLLHYVLVFPWTSSKALEESNIATPKKKKAFISLSL